MSVESVRYPIGEFVPPVAYPALQVQTSIATLDAFPEKLRQETTPLSAEQLDTRYRAGGWTIRQVIHHCADSHVNAYIRTRLALTEEEPVIKPYFEDRWAQLPDAWNGPVEPSLRLLEGLHTRWCSILRAFTEDQWVRGFFHPEKGRRIDLREVAAMYAWHCDHHLAHITQLKARKGW